MTRDPIHAHMRQAYDRIAPYYAAKNSEMRGGLVHLGMQFLKLLDQPSHVLDLGCGAGRDMAWLEAQEASVIGTDLSRGMLEQAARQVQGPLIQADMTSLPFAHGSFNGIWCMASLLHLPKAEAPVALAEMKRVLVPGGALVLGLQEGRSETWEVNPYEGVQERFFARYQLEEVEEMLVRAGFNVRYKDADVAATRSWLRLVAVAPS